MDEVHCAIAVISSEVAKFEMPQINAVTTSFLYVLPLLRRGPKPLPRPRYPSLSRGSGGVETTVQKYNFFLNR